MIPLTWVSLIPPVLVVFLAIWKKNITFALTSGIVCGLIILRTMALPGTIDSYNILDMTVYGLNLMVDSICADGNVLLILFLLVLGGIIAILTASGCANAFSAGAMKRLRTKRSAEGFTFLLGCLIFVDDYFNAITVGNVMVTITDRFKISRAKLAYLIDSTSAPVTILIPVSSWVATIISLIAPELAAYNLGHAGMSAFLSATVYNFYAWFTLAMVVAVILFDVNVGKMKKFEEDFEQTGIDGTIYVDVNESVVDDMAEKNRGTALDLILVLVFLVLATFFIMLYTGGLFAGDCTVSQAFLNCDPNVSLTAAAFATLLLCFILFVFTGRLSMSKFSSAFLQGLKSMVSVTVILCLSWTFSELMGSGGIMTGSFLAETFSGYLSGWLLPAAIFIISAIISFSTGASWGAMSIMFPTSIAICAAVDSTLINVVLGATLSGSVFGDHCSPLADTTVLSSSGAGCRHLDHVSSQLPYAVFVAVLCIFCFVAAALFSAVALSYLLGICGILAFAFVARKLSRKESVQKNEE